MIESEKEAIRMIFDWIENGEEIHRTGVIPCRDEWERKRVWTQEVNYARYLLYSLGESIGACPARLADLLGGTAEALAYDPDEMLGRLREIALTAKRLGPLEPLPRISVTRGEIRYLDSLSAPADVKRYWLGLLVYIKTKRAGIEKATLDKSVELWLLGKAHVRGRPDYARRRIMEWSLACGSPFRLSVSAKEPFYLVPSWCDFGRRSAEPLVSLKMGEQIESAMRLLDERSFVCPECGARFRRAPRAKTMLCGACSERKKAEYARIRKRRQRKKPI